MDIPVNLQEVVDELSAQVGSLIKENAILRNALANLTKDEKEDAAESEQPAQIEYAKKEEA